MLKRRKLLKLLLLAGEVACNALVLARADAGPGDFEWRRPGADPLRGISDQAAVAKLASDGLMSPEVQQQFLGLIRQGRFAWDEIPNDFRFTRMLFGRGVIAPNTIALTSQWPASASRQIRRYEVRTGGTVYVLVRPEVCGNWALRIVTIQGECIRDVAGCTPECEQLRKNQA